MIRVLQLEDDPDILEICEMALGMDGNFELLQCTSGDEAISKAQAFEPDLLLLDVMLPTMSGTDTLDHLRKLPGLETVPAVFFTARLQKGEVSALLARGASKVISKPFDPLSLGKEIIDIVGGQLGAAS